MNNKISELSQSTLNSFQSVSNEQIECCICNDIVNNEDSYMPNCKHSWCKICNEQINKNNIKNSPLCKIEFKRRLRNGKWKYSKNIYGFNNWQWEGGYEDSNRKLKLKKIQSFFLNFFPSFNSQINYSVTGVSV